MSPLAETIFFVFGLVALGYLCGWTGFLRTEVGDALSDFAVAVAVPMLLFRTMVNIDFGGGLPLALWATYFPGIVVTWIMAQIVMVRVFGRYAKAAVVGGLSASFSNLVLLGVPFMLGVYGQPGFEVLSLLVAVHLPSMMAASIVLFAWASRGEGASDPLAIFADFLRKLFSNPLVIGILAGLAWRATGIALPAIGVRFVDALANVAGTVALFAMGLGLRKFSISGNVAAAIAMAGLKLMVMPGIVLAMAVLIGLPPFTAKVAIAAASMPTGVNPYLVATRFGTGQALSSSTMTIATACAVVTTAFWLAVAHYVFG